MKLVLVFLWVRGVHSRDALLIDAAKCSGAHEAKESIYTVIADSRDQIEAKMEMYTEVTFVTELELRNGPVKTGRFRV